MSILQQISCVVLIVLMTFSQVSFAADPPLPTPVGRVIWIKGTLKATMENSEERNLQKTSVIYLHDVLTTGDQSEAQITFTDNSSVTFYPNTKFVVDKYAFAKKKKGSVGSYVGNLIQGGFRTITGLIAKENPDDYQVNTPVATIGVRGTDYAVYVNKNNQVHISAYSGKPCISNKTQPSELCLTENTTRYAFVSADNVPPVALSEQPEIFREKLNIIPATITPFGTTQSVTRTSSGGGVITSFCISQ